MISRVALVCASDRSDGAGRATTRLQRALVADGLDARLIVREKVSDDYRVEGPNGRYARAWSLVRKEAGQIVTKLFRPRPNAHSDPGLQSSNLLPSRFTRRLARWCPDIVHLHWVAADTISIKEIGRLPYPVVWTLHDMWAFCGARHYEQDEESARWRTGYQGRDIDALAWRAKKARWRKPLFIIAPSRWLADCVRASALMKDWPVTTIPNVLPVDVYKPLDRNHCRQIFGLPESDRIILFGAVGGQNDPRKGFDLLERALSELNVNDARDVLCVVFGESSPAKHHKFPLPIRWMGRLHDDAAIATLYNAADVMVVPSRLDVLPQTATEAQSCGCPVVAFDVAGLGDAVVHGETGYLAPPGQTAELAHGIALCLEDLERRRNWGRAARDRAVRLWSRSAVVPLIQNVYREAIEHYAESRFLRSRFM